MDIFTLALVTLGAVFCAIKNAWNDYRAFEAELGKLRDSDLEE